MSNEPSFAQKMIWSSRLQNPNPIITAPESLNVDKRILGEADKKTLETPICYGSFDNSSLCIDCDQIAECMGYTEILKDEKASSNSSFEVK